MNQLSFTVTIGNYKWRYGDMYGFIFITHYWKDGMQIDHKIVITHWFHDNLHYLMLSSLSLLYWWLIREC